MNLAFGKVKTTYRYNEVILEIIELNNRKLHKFTEDLYLTTDTIKEMDIHEVKWTDDMKDEDIFAKLDYGIRLILLKKTVNGYKTLYASHGSMDSYVLKLSFFRGEKKDDPFIILGETVAEESWGFSVFLLYNKPNPTIRDIGNIDLGVTDSEDLTDEINSVIPYTNISKENNRIIFKFSRDVVFNPGGENQRMIPGENIKYIFDGKELLMKESNQ